MPHATASRGRLCYRGGLTAPYYSHRWPGPAATAASHRSRTSEPSYSSPRGHPLPRLPRLCVVPFLGLAVVHRPGALGAAWSTWSTTNFHRKSTVRGEADSWVQAAARKCLLITRKIMLPPPDRRDPPDGPPYFMKKHSPCLLGPTSYIFARKEVPASQDPPGRSVRSVVILVANVYVYTGRRRGAHVS